MGVLPSPPLPLQILRTTAEFNSVNGNGNGKPVSSTVEDEIPTASATSTSVNCKSSTTRKIMKKENSSTDINYQDSSSTSSPTRSFSTVSSSRFSAQKRGLKLFTTRRNPKIVSRVGKPKQGCLEAFALPLGMSFAAIVDKVLERKGAVDDKLLVDHLSQICASAIRESLVNVFGEGFDSFVENFEKSFRSTLMTLQSINKSVKVNGRRSNRKFQRGEYFTNAGATMSSSSFNRVDNSANVFVTEECRSETLSPTSSPDEQASVHEDTIDSRNSQLILHDRQMIQQLPFAPLSCSAGAFDASNYGALLTTFEKSVVEQTRSNDLKTFKMGLTMRKMQQKERELALSSDSNFLERWKLSLGFSKTSFKFEKFRIQIEDTRYIELLKRCIDCLVSGLFVMLAALAYGVYTFSRQRIFEVTAACELMEESSKSWWMPKAVTSLNSGMQILKCQFQVLTRMFSGGFMILAIAYVLSQRSMTKSKIMPVTLLVILLGVMCGISGKLCIDTLGGDGCCWLKLWWTLCSVHIFSNIGTPTLFLILNGPITVSENIRKNGNPLVPYWCRRALFYTTATLFLPLMCGLLPFASLSEWKDHFSSLTTMNQLISVE